MPVGATSFMPDARHDIATPVFLSCGKNHRTVVLIENTLLQVLRSKRGLWCCRAVMWAPPEWKGAVLMQARGICKNCDGSACDIRLLK